MIRVYDQLITDEQTEYWYYGEVYELQQINRRDNKRYYTFKRQGSEPILVVPAFMEQFLEVCEIFSGLIDGKPAKDVRGIVRSKLDKKCVCTDFGEDKAIDFRYKDIKCGIDISGETVGLRPEFIIKSGNLFGNNITVHLDDRKEFFPYYADRFDGRR